MSKTMFTLLMLTEEAVAVSATVPQLISLGCF